MHCCKVGSGWVLGCSGDSVGLVMGHMGLLMTYYGGFWGILRGLTKSTDHPSIRYSVFTRWKVVVSKSRVIVGARGDVNGLNKLIGFSK